MKGVGVPLGSSMLLKLKSVTASTIPTKQCWCCFSVIYTRVCLTQPQVQAPQPFNLILQS